MTTTLTSIIISAAIVLSDSANAVFDTAALTEAVRLALGELNLARETAGLAPAALSGLAGAAETTLSPSHDSLLVTGACAYAASSRSAGSAESFTPGSDPEAHRRWAESAFTAFRVMLDALYPTYRDPAARASAAETLRVANLRAGTGPICASWPEV